MTRVPGAPGASHPAATARSHAVARGWRDNPAYRRLADAFDAVDPADPAAVARAAHALLLDPGWLSPLIDPLIAMLHDDPWFEPPLTTHRDPLRAGAVLLDHPAVAISAAMLSAATLAASPPPATVVVPGRLAIVRYVSAGGATLRLWHAGRIGADFSVATAPRAYPLGALPLGDGVVLRIDGRTRATLIEDARSDVVTLTATVRAGAAPAMREYDRATGTFLRSATLDDGASRAQMLLTLLRVAGAADAGDRFEAATRDAAFFLRWSAMREWLATDWRRARPRLAEMAASDPHDEVRALAAATLAQLPDERAG